MTQYAKYPSSTGGGGGGSVTSVGLNAPSSIFSVSGSPVTSSGNLALSLIAQPANTVWAGPTSGAPNIPSFRALVPADLPAIALTGDATGTYSAGTIPVVFATVNASPGTYAYATVTVNGKGLITSATANSPVTSVALSAPSSVFTVSGSPVTGSGTLALAFATQAPNMVFAGPSSGAAANPTFRALTLADFPQTSGFSFLTSGTTYTTPSNITALTQFKFTLVGGGGGGGGINTNNAKASGGGGGGCAIVIVSGLTASTAYTIAIGAGGSGGISTTTPATAGGNTTLTIGATTYTAGGGSAGTDTIDSAGGAGGTTTNATVGLPGQDGAASGAATANAPWGDGGLAMGPIGGSGGRGLAGNTTDGNSGKTYGGGGGGSVGVATTGGAGAQGAILVEWSN